jgi:hypothetical protein
MANNYRVNVQIELVVDGQRILYAAILIAAS